VHVLAVRSEGFTDYHIKPAGDRDELSSIIYLEPFDWHNRRAFGFDMFTEPARRAAMILARDRGAPSISGKVTLVQETDHGVQNGFLMYLPVYQTAVPPATVEERGAGLVGYVYAPFRMRDLMRGILGSDQFSGVRLEIYDEASFHEENKLFCDPCRRSSGTGLGLAGANTFLSKPINQEHLFLEVGKLLELSWIYQRDVVAVGVAGGMIVAPPDTELLRLYEAAKVGNMRRIRELADDIAAGNATVGPFAARLREFADAHDSKALVAFVGSYIDEKRGAAA
jgi:hypothetical protein